MAIPEDIMDLWSEFPLQLKIEPLDDLFGSDFIAIPKKKVVENPVADEIAGEPDSVLDAFEEVEPQKPPDQNGTTALEVVGSDNAVVSGIYKPSKLYAYEDFHSFLAREGGLNQDRLSRLMDDVSPLPHEDFVAFIARSNGMEDEQMINRLRQALKLEPAIEFKPRMKPTRPVKTEVDMDLKVLEGEDAASFFVRAGSWESASSISEELASVGLNEFADEDAESFFRRTESTGDSELEDGEFANGSLHGGASIALISTPKQEEEVLQDQTLLLANGPSESSESVPSSNQVVLKKRKSSDE